MSRTPIRMSDLRRDSVTPGRSRARTKKDAGRRHRGRWGRRRAVGRHLFFEGRRREREKESAERLGVREKDVAERRREAEKKRAERIPNEVKDEEPKARLVGTITGRSRPY